MKAGGGRNKGSAFERKVAKLIIATFANKGITKQDCYRTPGSGGHRFASKTDPGDLVLSPKLRKLFDYCVECKSYKTVPWGRLLSSGNNGIFDDWWKQTCKAAKTTKAPPLLVFKHNGSEPYVMVRLIDIKSFVLRRPYIRLRIAKDKVHVSTLRWFLESVHDKTR